MDMEIKCPECGEYFKASLGQCPACDPPKRAADPPEVEPPVVRIPPVPPRLPEKKCPHRSTAAKIFAGLRGLFFSTSAEPARVILPTVEAFLCHTKQPNVNTRTLLKEATALKRAKRYDEAVLMLRRAYETPPGPMGIGERLRLPMYLQLAGRADEGWGEMNRLNIKYVDQSSQITIAAHMAAFLRKEGNSRNAALFEVWTLCKYKESDVETHAAILRMADQKPASDAEWKALGLPPFPRGQKTGTTPRGNPIYDVSYPSVHRRLDEDYDSEAIRDALDSDLGRVVEKKIISAMVADLSRYLAEPPPYDIEILKSTFDKYLA